MNDENDGASVIVAVFALIALIKLKLHAKDN